MGGLVSSLGQGLGIIADPDAGAGAYGEADTLARRAVAELEKLGVPSIEAQKIALRLPEVVGQLEAEQLDASAFEDIIEDPALRENVLKAIQGTEELAETGFGAEDRARLDAMRRAAQADEQARQASILQSFAERGALGSGSELAARLSSAQGTADRASQAAIDLAAQGQAQRRAALGDLASMSGNLRAQDLQKDQRAAAARDQFAQFNALQRAGVAQQNLAQQQAIANQRTNLQNQQQQYNKGLIQQNFQNRLQKATGVSGGLQNLAQTQMQRGQQQAAAAQAEAAGTRGLLIGGAQIAMGMPPIGAGGGGLGASSTGGVSSGLNAAGGPMTMSAGFKEGGVKYQDGGISKEKIQGMIEALEMMKKGPNQIVDNPYTQSNEEAAMEDIIDNDVRPMMMPDKGQPMPTNISGALYNEGGAKKYGNLAQYAEYGYDNIHPERSEGMDEQKAAKRNKILRELLGGVGAKKLASDQFAGKVNFTPDENLMLLQERLKIANSDQERNFIENAILQNIESGVKYNEGGVESPISYAADGMRIDEKLDNGELALNESAQDELMEYLRGNMESEDMSQGRIIEGDNYSGDLLPDRINSGEMVLNVPQQERAKQDIENKDAELNGYRKLIQLIGKK